MMSKYKDLFSPINIGTCEIPNRFFMAPMGAVGMTDAQGSYTDKAIEYYAQRAKGGTGLIITGITKVEKTVEAFGTPGIGVLNVNNAAFFQSAAVMCEKVHAYNSKIFLQLGFGFGRAMVPAAISGGAGRVAPSEVENRWNPNVIHRELTTEEVESLIKDTIMGAVIAKKSGYDGVEIHAVHEGYLLDQFTMELFNRRTDKYGGSFENRYRAAVEIVQGIKKACGKDFPVSLRYSVKGFIKEIRQGGLPGESFEEKGRDVEEGKKAAKYLVDAGYDALNVDCGTYDSWYWNHPPMYFKDGMYLEYAKEVKEVVDVPVMVAGHMDDPDLAINAIHDGSADMIGLGRPLLADAEIPNKIRMDKIENIRPCLSCHDGCLGRLKQGLPISCAVNPSCANEKEHKLVACDRAKKVLIIGGGVSGMEAARVLAERGHLPTLLEASDRLGGSLIPGGVPSFKVNDRKLVKWYENQLKNLNVDVRMNTRADKSTIEDSDYDVVIVATGATPIQINLDGAEKNNFLNGLEASMHLDRVGDEVVIIGAGLVGAELGLSLAQSGKKVSIVELTDQILGGEESMCFANYDMLKDLLKFNKVEIFTETRADSINEEGLVVLKKDGSKETVNADTIISAIGYKSEHSLFDEIKMSKKELYLVGDSKNVHNIMYAIWDAFEIARNI
ncbi:MAG: FAD-dependent oxidoreductase [Clostridioides sp.]|jgi:2-enoate reductase|nr:FAD-dependent oxidoreductase [Clostridioides sp.]